MDLNVPIAQQLPQIQEGISNSIGNVATSLGDVRSSVNSSVQDFASKDLVGSSTEFLQSNTIIAKFVFLIMILIAFLILMNLGIYLISYFLAPNKSPYVVKGIQPGNTKKQVTQDPGISDSVTIYRSNNQTTGMEYTWSVWLNIVELNTSYQYSHVFSKGLSNVPGADGLMPQGSNAPGMYLQTVPAPDSSNVNSCTMTIVMDTVTGTPETVDVTNIPFKKWVNVALRLENKILDIYINGILTQRYAFTNVPKQNYGDVWVCQNGGFNGNLSNLRYFDRALNAFQLTSITATGPNMSSTTDIVDTSSDYLSSGWFFK